ncbi:unnamed protein product [Arabidopsis thaliana]|uniref:Uncharacterized protein n=1 Tax=Arabidopsis thaliana TaxID=3702 RepID=A0A654EJC8_ARATH|nr:unnamed protein product [Arabidopsis thaliana]
MGGYKEVVLLRNPSRGVGKSEPETFVCLSKDDERSPKKSSGINQISSYLRRFLGTIKRKHYGWGTYFVWYTKPVEPTESRMRAISGSRRSNRRRYALGIGGLSNRISKVIRDMQSFGVQQAIVDGGYMQPQGDRQREMRPKFSKDDDSDFVGLEANVKKLVGYLVDEANVQVVSITGMGGLDFTRMNVWQKILRDLKPKEEEKKIMEMTQDTLQGWKVLLTSRNESVAMRRNTSYINFKPECLTTEDSWTLFQRIALPIKDAAEFKIDEEKEELGKLMIKHCGGLPLAIKVLGEDYEIKVENLSYYWAAEGIFQPRHYDGETIRDVGDSYMDELVRRNMVISERDVETSRFETCHLHDMREVCLLKAKEDNFLQITSSSFTRLELLRVLDLVQAKLKGGKLASCIGKLIHLRYLSLKHAKVTHIPYSLGNLKLLIYLNLAMLYSTRFYFVPNVLMGMQQLRYLALPYEMTRKTKLELSNLVKLETLENFSTKNSSLEDLRGMVRLRTLTIKLIEETSLETLAASIGGLKYLESLTITDLGSEMRTKEAGIVFDFVHLKRLSGKKMVCSSGGFPQLQKLSISGLEEWDDWKVEESSMPLLHTLDIYGCRKLKQLPDEHFPSHLTSISLGYCCLEKDPMPTLERLVHLKEITLGDSFGGRIMVCAGSGFPQLHKLQLSELDGLEEWIVEDGSMPLLHTLRIWNCPKLKQLPDGLRFIYSLKNLTVPKRWKKRLSKGGEDYYKVQHIPSVEFF